MLEIFEVLLDRLQDSIGNLVHRSTCGFRKCLLIDIHGGANVSVPQLNLHIFQIGAVTLCMGSKGSSENLKVHRSLDVKLLDDWFDPAPQPTLRTQWPTSF